MDNYRTGTPVRVFRLVSAPPPVYVYEGLYQVVDHRLEKSSDGPKVSGAFLTQSSVCRRAWQVWTIGLVAWQGETPLCDQRQSSVFEGLYQVVDHRLEKSSDGPKVSLYRWWHAQPCMQPYLAGVDIRAGCMAR